VKGLLVASLAWLRGKPGPAASPLVLSCQAGLHCDARIGREGHKLRFGSNIRACFFALPLP
jgi:hypothetical protein